MARAKNVNLTTRNGLFSGRSSAGLLVQRGLLAAVLAAVANALVLVVVSSRAGRAGSVKEGGFFSIAARFVPKVVHDKEG